MIFLSDNEFCINCGVINYREVTQKGCNHLFKKPLEFFIPSIELYGKDNIEWVLYTVDDKVHTVYIDSADFTGPRQNIGIGGIALRNFRLVFQKVFLNDPKIFDLIKTALKIDDDIKTKEILRLLSYLEELYRNIRVWALSDFIFTNPFYPSLNLENSPFMQFLDITGTIKLAEIFKNLAIHGKWGAKMLLVK